MLSRSATAANPGTSVVSPHLQHWDALNLFVVGASVFAHNAGYNPTGPLAALALRVGDDIASYVQHPRMLQGSRSKAEVKGSLQ